MRTTRPAWAFVAALALWLTGCAVGPKYQRAQVPTPPAWKTEEPFRAATPMDTLPKGTWWTIFADNDLNQLEAQAIAANQTIEAARNQLLQARASAQITAAGLYPSLNATPSLERQRISGNRPLNGARIAATPITQNVYSLPFNLNYELDLFGGVRRSVEAANAQYQSSAANLENVRLLVTSELAADYFMLRESDAEISVVNSAVDYEQRGLELVERRHQGGVASGLDVSQQESLLDSTRTQAELLRQQRAQYEHAIAALVGTPASSFTLAPKPMSFAPPTIPVGVPSDILERRPDVAAFERQMAAENADIGVAESAYYPSISIFGQGGLQSSGITNLFSLPSTVWALGAGLTQNILNGGRTRAQVNFYKAGYQASVANYRQTVLTAFQQVEDALAGLSVLSRAAETQQHAVDDAQTTLRIANDRYVGGIATYLDVITAQETLLTNQRLATQILGQQLVTSVYLVKALGGGWDSASLQAMRVTPNLKQAVTP